MEHSYLIIGIVAFTIIVAYSWYVSMVFKRNKVQEAFSGIDVQLQQRMSLIPNILTIAQKFMTHEKSLMTEITELRTKADSINKEAKDPESLKKYFAASEALAGKVGQLMLAVENYPNLKSDQTMIMAMQSYNEIEAQIAAARRFYNASVNDLNNTVQLFPKNIVAALVGIKAMPFYLADEQAKQAVNAEAYLK